MQELIIQIMNDYGYLGITLLIAVENLFPPIPSEIILTFGGFMTTYTTMRIWGVILFATLGSVVGAIILYGVGRWFSPRKLERWLDGKWGRRLHFKKGDVRKATAWFERHGRLTVFFCRFIPIVRSLISIPAGIAKMNMPSFLILTTVGTLIWNTVLVYLGAFAGASWETISGYFDTYSSITLYVLIVIAIICAAFFFKNRFIKR